MHSPFVRCTLLIEFHSQVKEIRKIAQFWLSIKGLSEFEKTPSNPSIIWYTVILKSQSMLYKLFIFPTDFASLDLIETHLLN